MYVLSDPTYDGSSTLYSIPIKGMNEYRAGLYAQAAKNSSLKKISHVLSLCRDADLKIKSESTNYDRLRSLICKAAKG